MRAPSLVSAPTAAPNQAPASAAPQTSDATVSRFNLTRHFSLACLLGMVVSTFIVIAMVRELTRHHVESHGAEDNTDRARAFAASIWQDHASFIQTSMGAQAAAAPQDDANIALLRAHTMKLMGDTGVVRVKIYNLDGSTVFSTDPTQIGQSRKTNPGFVAAAAGSVATELTHRDEFSAFHGTLADRDLLSSYVPIRADGQVQAVVEIYSDVTQMLADLSTWQWRVGVLIVAIFLCLYAFLFFVVRKADGLLHRHDEERVRRERQIWHQAHHDPLTDLPNRSFFANELDAALRSHCGQPTCGALLFVDLDRFKMVNDSFGHQAGDAVLSSAADRMRGCLRADDRLFRIGGDEFAIILSLRSPEGAAQVASRVTHAMSQPIDLHGQRFCIGATVGIALMPADGGDADTLVSSANAAMRSAKRERRGEHMFYSADMNERTRARLAMEAELQRAFNQREFVLHYQPRVTTGGAHIRSLEALIRWQRPGHGLVPPAVFIGVLEHMDLMTHVGEWVLRTACTQLRDWHDQGFTHVGVSVNVAARQLEQPDFADMVRRVLTETRVDPRCVELELTESVLISRPDEARGVLSSLRTLGVRIAIDDFGTGYASLTYLRELAVDVVKLDRSFVSGVEHNPKDRALCTAIGEMARALNLTMVAEGVETEAQLSFLTSIHCVEMQGYLFSRPQAPENLVAMLAADAPNALPPQPPGGLWINCVPTPALV